MISQYGIIVSNATNINHVGGSIGNVNTVAGQISPTNNIATLAGISGLSSLAAASAAVTNVNNNLNSVNNFADVYRVSANAPTSSLNDGDLWFDTTADKLKVYDGSSFALAGSSVNGTTARFKYTASNNQTTFSGSDANSNTLAYDVAGGVLFADIYLNGIKLVAGTDITATNGTSIVLAAGANANDRASANVNATANANVESSNSPTSSARVSARASVQTNCTHNASSSERASANANVVKVLMRMPV